MDAIEVVIGDVHARADLLRTLLVTLGGLDSRGHRRPGYWIVQVGDLLDRRASPGANLQTARLAAHALDVVLAGNHEVEMLAGRGRSHGAALATLAARGWLQAAAELSGWVVTHAGVHPGLTHGLAPTADECVAEINDRWHRRSPTRIGDPLFDWVGPARGGISPYGGLFCRGGPEWPPGARTPWGQICGHVPQPRPRLLSGPRWQIDLGSTGPRLAALCRRPSQSTWRPMIVHASPGGVAVTRLPRKRPRTLAA